jgi:hypothetical protein
VAIERLDVSGSFHSPQEIALSRKQPSQERMVKATKDDVDHEEKSGHEGRLETLHVSDTLWV